MEKNKYDISFYAYLKVLVNLKDDFYEFLYNCNINYLMLLDEYFNIVILRIDEDLKK